MSTPPETTAVEIRLRLERQTDRSCVYSVEPWGFATSDLIKLSTIGVQQQFLGRVPKVITATFEVKE